MSWDEGAVMSKEQELLQRLVDIVGDCESTDKLLELADEVESYLNPRICNFCTRTAHEVEYLVSANKDVAICGDCIDIARNEIDSKSGADKPEPKEIWVVYAGGIRQMAFDNLPEAQAANHWTSPPVKYIEDLSDER